MASVTIFCVDPRVPAIAKQILDELEPGNSEAYTTTAIGGSLNISGELQKIATMVEKLDVTRVNMVDHLTCAAFRMAFGEKDLEEEEGLHREYMKKAVLQVKQHFPDVDVRACLLNSATPEALAPELVEVN